LVRRVRGHSGRRAGGWRTRTVSRWSATDLSYWECGCPLRNLDVAPAAHGEPRRPSATSDTTATRCRHRPGCGQPSWETPYMTSDDEELALIAAIREGDVVQHPKTLAWMRAVRIHEGAATDTKYARGRQPDGRREPYRRIFLDRLDRHPYETPFLQELYCRDL